jgi:DNA-binding transcriptional LysR family regulator
VPILEKLNGASPSLTLAVTIDFSRTLLDAFDGGELDAIVVRQEGSRRGGEMLCTDDFGWFASPAFQWNRSEPLRVAALRALRRPRDGRSRARQAARQVDRIFCRGRR